MKTPVLVLVALALVAAAILFFFRLDPPSRGASPESLATPPATAETPRPTAELTAPAPAALEEAPAAPGTTAPAPSGEGEAVPQREEARAEGSRTVTGVVTLPSGAPPDDTLRVLALRDFLAPFQIYGKSGVLADWQEGRREKVVGTAAVEASGAFHLNLSTTDTVWLAIDGRYLYSKQPVALEADAAGVTLPAELGASLSGRVVLPSGLADAPKALSELEIELGPDSGDFAMGRGEIVFSRCTKVDAEGRFELRALKSEIPQQLTAESDLCADAKIAGISLQPGERRELEVALVEGATLGGTVRDAAGQPVAEAEVHAAEIGFWGFPGEELAETKSDAQGQFTLAHVRPGKVMVVAKHDGHLDSEAEKLELADRDARTNLRLVLDAGQSIRGQVRFADGGAAAGAKIDVSFDLSAMVGMGAMNAARGAEGKATCDGDGRFTVTGLGKGPFTVKAESERKTDAGAEVWRAKQSKVAPGTEGLELTLSAPCVLAGRVVDAGGKGVTDYDLRVHSAGAVFFDPGQTRDRHVQEAEGRFSIPDLEAGEWEVSARAEGFGPAAPRKVTLPWSEPAPLVITLAPAASVAGTVLDPSGAPVAGATITTHVDVAQRMQRLRGKSADPKAQSAEDGTFTLEGLGAGAAAIVASHEEFSSREPAPVELRTGETTRGVVLRLRKGATVTGEVYGPDGKPAGGVRVLAQTAGGLDMSTKNADSQGLFKIDNLAPGSWTITALLDVRAVDPGSETDDASAAFLENMRFTMVELADGEEKHVVLGAPPKDPVVLHGRVQDRKSVV